MKVKTLIYYTNILICLDYNNILYYASVAAQQGFYETYVSWLYELL